MDHTQTLKHTQILKHTQKQSPALGMHKVAKMIHRMIAFENSENYNVTSGTRRCGMTRAVGIFSSACVYSAELLSWRRHPFFIRRPSVKSGFSETAAWIQTTFYGKLPIQHISRHFFLNFNFQIFTIFFPFSLTWDPMRAKISKRYSSSSFIWSKPNFMINSVVMRE